MAKTGPIGRSPDQIAKDRVEVANLYLRGHTQADIAAKLGLSRQQITYDLAQVRKMWRESAIVDFDAKKDQELAKLDNLELTYWQAWERSCQEKTITKTAKTDDGSRAEITKMQMLGDPRYLDGVFRCIQKRCEIFGLDAPKKIAPTTPDGEQPYNLSGVPTDVLEAVTRQIDPYMSLINGQATEN